MSTNIINCRQISAQSRDILTAGFTLIEAIVAVAIMTLIGGGIIAFQKSVISNSRVLQSGLISQQQVRKVLASFTAELRAAGQSANGSFAIESIATSSIVFYTNADNDVAIERVRYFFGTTSDAGGVYDALYKGVTKPSGTSYVTGVESVSAVVRNLKNDAATPIFTYFDSTYNGLASSTAPLAWPVVIPTVRLVKISLVVDPNIAGSNVYKTHETVVSIRNLKDNL